MKVLMVSAEVYPFAKTGGLADMSAALAAALSAAGVDVKVLMPAYPSALAHASGHATLHDPRGDSLETRLLNATLPGSDCELWLLDRPDLYRRAGTPYQDQEGNDWPDNALRYAALCEAAARIAVGGLVPGWRPDVVHCHDWHGGLVPLLLSRHAGRRSKTVFTVHNASFQGNFPMPDTAGLGLPAEALSTDGAEFHGRFSFLKAGIRYADAITTVSPGYARELLTPEYGCGLEGLFRAREHDTVGIMNGIDEALWNPQTDPWLAKRYSPEHPRGKSSCKRELQRVLGLDHDAHAPFGIFASRITGQKMADVLAAVLPGMLAAQPRMQFAILGRGERWIERALVKTCARFPGRAAAVIGYEEPLAHRLHAGADFLFHGSRFEPCGLSQMYAMRYGTLPIVRRIGGLADSVLDADAANEDATGFVFDAPGEGDLVKAMTRCVALYENRPKRWNRMQKNAMNMNFGWSHGVREYIHLYEGQLGARRSDAPAGAGEPAPAAMPSRPSNQHPPAVKARSRGGLSHATRKQRLSPSRSDGTTSPAPGPGVLRPA